jgi:hypothetical protein
MDFCAYLALALLPVIGFQDRRSGLKAGLSMFLLGVLIGGWPAFLSRSPPSNSGMSLPPARASVAVPC